jgi:hypothetical protein
MKKRKATATAMALSMLMLAGLAGCSQNEFTERGPEPKAPVNPPPAQRVEKGEGMAGGMTEPPPPPEPQAVRYTGSVILPAALAPKVKPGMVLFLIASTPAGAPAGPSGQAKAMPLAARRFADLDTTSFPLSFELDQADSMSGQPLPPAAEIRVRLDSDGDLATLRAGDLVAGPVSVQAGKPAVMALKEHTP